MKNLLSNHVKWLLLPLVFVTLSVGHASAASTSVTTTSNTSWTVDGRTWTSSNCTAAGSYLAMKKNTSTITVGTTIPMDLSGSNNVTITVGAGYYGGKQANVTAKLTDGSGNVISNVGTAQPTSNGNKSYTITLTPSNRAITAVKVAIGVSGATNDSKYIRLYSFTITYTALATYTLKLPKGDGTYATSSTTSKSDLADDDIPFGSANCGGETLNGSFAYYWVTSAIPQASALDNLPSTKYNSSNAPAYDVTLYPLFYDGTTSKVHTAPSCVAACDKSVTINQGAATNCSFTLSATGAQPSCSGTVPITVTVTPNTGYGLPVVSETLGTATITGSGNNWTVTYPANTNSSSTISVSCSAKVATPTFSPIAGTYTGTQNVTISCGTAGATIYYTTNGSMPTTSSSVYNNTPISVTQGTTIKAFATKSGQPDSDVATAAYIIQHTVTWSVNGSTTTSTVTHGQNASTPSPDPSATGDCAGLVFRGWTDSPISGTSASAPSVLFTGTTPSAITGNVTFYAVFAEVDN